MSDLWFVSVLCIINTSIMTNQKKYQANTIAKYFINKASENVISEDGQKEGITNLKLQKMLYFAQAFFLVKTKKVIFSDKIEAWEFGPVIPSIYHEYKNYKNKPITGAYDLKIDADDENLLNSVWEIFGQYSASHLVDMSHAHQPWKDAFGSKDKTITPKSIEKYYIGLLNN